MDTIEEMSPLWDGDVEDETVDNILKVSFGKGWKWKNRHWPDIGVNSYKRPGIESDSRL